MPDIDIIYLYVKDPFESKYQLLINEREKIGIKKTKNLKASIDDFYENLEDYNPTKKRKLLVVFNDMTTGMESNRTLSPIVTELILRGRKLNISLVLISQYYFKVPETISLNAIHYFIMKIPSKRELQQVISLSSGSISKY